MSNLKQKINKCKQKYIFIDGQNNNITVYDKQKDKFFKLVKNDKIFTNKKYNVEITNDQFIDIYLQTQDLGKQINSKFKVKVQENKLTNKAIIIQEASKGRVYKFKNLNGKLQSAIVDSTSGLFNLDLKEKITVKIPISSSGTKQEITFKLPDKLKQKYNEYKKAKEDKSQQKLQEYHNLTQKLNKQITQEIFKQAQKFDKRIVKVIESVINRYNEKEQQTNVE